MEVIVNSSPKIEIELATKVVKVGGGGKVTVDSALSTTSENPVQNKVITDELGKKATKAEVSSLSTVVGEELNTLNESILENGEKISSLDANKADTSGYYPNLRVGLSDNLPDRGDVIEGEIGFRESAGAGNSIEDGTANVQELLGNSVVWNQIATISGLNSTFSQNGDKYVATPTSTPYAPGNMAASSGRLRLLPNCVINHVYLYDFGFTRLSKRADIDDFTPIDMAVLVGTVSRFYAANIGEKKHINGILTAQDTSYIAVSLNDCVCEIDSPIIIDLTQMFGAGKEPSTIEEFNAIKNQLVGVDFNAYNAGEVIGVNPTGIKSVNDNAWDEEWELGRLNTDTGQPNLGNNGITSKNYIRVLPNETYYCGYNDTPIFAMFYDAEYNLITQVSGSNNFINIRSRQFTTPANAMYMKFYVVNITTYNHDICIRLAHSGYKTDYVAHEEDVMPLDLTEVFPNGMHGIGDVRDSATPKKATRRYGVKKLKDLRWENDNISASLTGIRFESSTIDDIIKSVPNNAIAPIISSKYVARTAVDTYMAIRGIAVKSTGTLSIYDSAYANAESFAASLTDDDVIIYELATPIETEIDPKLNLSYKVWDFGTEELLSNGKSAPIGVKTIYGFNATDTIRGNKAKNEEQDERMRILEGEVVRKGDYSPENKVGLADDLAGRGESVPASFGFRASGGKSIKDGRAYIKRIKGNSVVWNQTIEKPYTKFFTNRVTYSIENNVVRCVVNSIAYPFVGIYSNKVEKQHTYLVAFKYLGNKNAYVEGGIEYQGQGINIAANKPTQFTAIKKASEAARIGFVMATTIESMEIGDTFEIHDINVYDLTKMFGAGNEPTTIEDFNTRVATLGVDMNAYNEGEVIHCNTESIKSVGDNAWDEEWDVGTITEAGGIDYPSASYSRTRGYVKVIGGEQYAITSPSQKIVYLYYYDGNKNYTFHKYVNATLNGDIVTIPSNCQYMRFTFYGTTYNHDIMISLVHSGWKVDTDAGYQPYWQDTLPLPIIRKYFPDGMKLAGSAHDEIRFNKASGKWEYSKGKIKSVDMGTLNWGLTSQMYFRANLPSDSIIPTSVNYNGFLCAKYERVNFNLIYGQSVTTPCFGVSANNGMIGVYDSSYTDAATFKAAMQGVMLYYESNDWEWVELDAEDQNFRDYYNVADFGTEQSQSSVPSAAFSADIIYQFNAVDMIREHELEITELQSIIATMQAQLTSLTNGGQ